MLPGFGLVPGGWGLALTVTYLVQAVVSHLLERRYEPGMIRSMFWMIWYPLAFWMISCATTVAGLPRARAAAAAGDVDEPGQGRAMSDSVQPKPWPPVINAALPAWMKWRDAVLTLFMWGLFAWLLQRQFRLVNRSVDGRSDLVDFLTLLAPYAGMAVVLIGILAMAAMLTERRRQRALMQRPPPPLALSDEARGAGMDEAALAAARGLRIAVVHIETGGRFRIEPRQAASVTPH